jgi:glycosyltransferase involved in cell wall biosynthesis
VPFAARDFTTGDRSRKKDTSWQSALGSDNPFLINVFHINADQMEVAFRHLTAEFFEGRYNIGFWHWELPEFPDRWLASFRLVQEVWVPSQFVQQALAAKAPVPVLRMPHAVDFQVSSQASRSALGLPENKFLFLTMYDIQSVQARKNPQGAIDAFRKAFPRPKDVSLVVKVNNGSSNPQEMRELTALSADVPGVCLLPDTLSRQQTYDLLALCDCFVSLHRSEGFGLPIAESMFLGKPVIATNWSGNCDFMDEENSCPVAFKLVALDRDYGPYQKGQKWAEPDLDHAANHMIRCLEDVRWRDKIGRRGQETIRTRLAPYVIGDRYRRRLEKLQGVVGAVRLVAA